jgi:hypothetical protein
MAEVVIPDATARAFEPPRNVQFSVFLDNRVGKLMELIQALDAVALRVVAMSVVDSADHAVVRILTSRAELAKRLLARNNFTFSQTDVLVVQLEPAFSIANLCDALLRAELNIFYAYSLIDHPMGKPAIVIHCDDPVLACQILRRRMFTVLGENDLGENMNPGDPSIN